MTGPRDPRVHDFLRRLLQQHPGITLAHARDAAQSEDLEIGSYHYYKALRDLGIARKRGRPKKSVTRAKVSQSVANTGQAIRPNPASMFDISDSVEGLQHALDQARITHRECHRYRAALERVLAEIHRVLD